MKPWYLQKTAWASILSTISSTVAMIQLFVHQDSKAAAACVIISAYINAINPNFARAGGVGAAKEVAAATVESMELEHGPNAHATTEPLKGVLKK